MLFPGNPIPLARPRFSKSCYRKVFDSQQNLKLVTGLQITKQHDNQPFLEGPIHLDVTFYMPISKTNKKKVGPNMYHATIPDLSNCLKFIEDICSGVVYKDDAIIASINSKKMYDNDPRTEFFFTSLGGKIDKKG